MGPATATPLSGPHTANPAGKGTTSPVLPDATKTKKNKKIRQSIFETAKHGSPIHTRPRLAENYADPVSEREGWWRKAIRETPAPGAYESDTFIKELTIRPNTYRFKSDGRVRDPQPQIGKGKLLLPGAYGYEDMTSRIDKFRNTYGFKDTGRDKRDYLNFGKKDKDINVPPDAYAMEKYMSLSVEKSPSKHQVFRSQVQRFPTVYFTPKEGPGPGNYEYAAPPGLHAVSSSFKSKTARFRTSHTKTPGPGTYEKTFQSPIPKTIVKMGRNHGIFFSSAFQV